MARIWVLRYVERLRVVSEVARVSSFRSAIEPDRPREPTLVRHRPSITADAAARVEHDAWSLQCSGERDDLGRENGGSDGVGGPDGVRARWVIKHRT